VLELLMKQQRAVVQQDHITMSIVTLDTTELIRDINKDAIQGCPLDETRSRKTSELWQGLQEMHYYMRKRSFAMFHNFMMTQ
jgi:hypothetical protein